MFALFSISCCIYHWYFVQHKNGKNARWVVVCLHCKQYGYFIVFPFFLIFCIMVVYENYWTAITWYKLNWKDLKIISKYWLCESSTIYLFNCWFFFSITFNNLKIKLAILVMVGGGILNLCEVVCTYRAVKFCVHMLDFFKRNSTNSVLLLLWKRLHILLKVDIFSVF